MNRTRTRRAAAVTAAGLVLVLTPPAVADSQTSNGSAPAASAGRSGQSMMPMPTSPTAYDFGETLARLDGRQLEITFMASIIGHHKAAIEMARMELQRGRSADIRTHAENIISSQQNQIDQFTRWLRQWYGLTPEQARSQAPREAQQEMAMMDRETARTMAELRATPAGAGFDVAFVKRIIGHHQAGIIEFLEPQSRAPHAELRVAAATGAMTQESEATDFRTWLAGRS